MNFIDLDRAFVPLLKDREPILDFGSVWSRKLAGWLNWQELLERPRVVLLAEAGSGKTEELRHQSDRLNDEGKAAFFVRIEELADHGFIAALDHTTGQRFRDWQSSNTSGWFFLDSVDEARLNRRNFETALKRFAQDLGPSLERAQVLVSCRMTDWRGTPDVAAISRVLPAWERPGATPVLAEDAALLNPIFEEQGRKRDDSSKPKEELLVVQLVPLTEAQRATLAAAAGIADVKAFTDAIAQHGLEAFAERPGDLLDLAEYWSNHHRFGTLFEMVEDGVQRKLGEQPDRAESDVLSLTHARSGAERLAAALTLGKSFTLQAPGHDPDPSLNQGAIDPAEVLANWTAAEQAALLRRPIFAPATYGRIRFHHRSSQEFLTASWLNRLLQENCPRAELWGLLFADLYGVQTMIPTLHSAAAWLALSHADILDEIIKREPVVLMRNGDPQSLSLDAKRRVLASYAAKHARGEIADDMIDRRAMWMFAHPGLADAIHKAWRANAREDFHFELLRLIREGGLSACADLAREVATDATAQDYHRSIAVEALAAFGDTQTLPQVAATLIESPAGISSRLACQLCEALFPSYIDVEQLLSIMAAARVPEESAPYGFRYSTFAFYEACPDALTRARLVAGIADLALSPPLLDAYDRVSRRHQQLARHLGKIATREIQALGDNDPLPGLLRLLMAVERGGGHDTSDDEGALHTLVRSNARVHRSLFWSDVTDCRTASHSELVAYWHIHCAGNQLWELGPADLPWLFRDLQEQALEADQRVALTAILSVMFRAGTLTEKQAEIRSLIGTNATLLADLDRFLTPPTESEDSRRLRLDHARRERETKRNDSKARQSWVTFRSELQSNPDQLRDPKIVGAWETGAFRLKHLTVWLHRRTNSDYDAAARNWRLLEEGFGRVVAEAYRDGMRLLWRLTKPQAPTQANGGAVTTNWMTILAWAGVNLEASEDADWADRLTEKEAERATRHCCMSRQGYAACVEALIASHPTTALPILKTTITQEWNSPQGSGSSFLYHYADQNSTISLPIQDVLLGIISGPEPSDLARIDLALRIVDRVDPSDAQRKKLVALARRRFSRHRAARRDDFVIRSIALLLVLTPNQTVDLLATWLTDAPQEQRGHRAEKSFAILFDRHRPLVAGMLDRATVPTLERLLHVVYLHVRPEDDAVHEGSYSPDLRDNAENARNTILTALLNRPGADAFRAMIRLASDPVLESRAIRFLELARGKAERDSEFPAWLPAETNALEAQHTAAIKTGHELIRIVMSVLSDIQFQLSKGDMTSRPLLQRAQNEEEVQNWIAEQMNYRSRGRFLAYREAQVAGGDMPDIIVSSSAARSEVAIEVKHDGKGWTAKDLEKALRVQLAEDYLKPATRRHGVLVISHHRPRTWIHPTTKKRMEFVDLIEWLSAAATSILENSSGTIVVYCVGIDATEPNPQPLANKRPILN